MPKLVLHRYFLAALPAPANARKIRAWAEAELGAKGLQEAARLHATLAITDDFASPQPEWEKALLRAAEAVRGAPFDLVLDRLSFSGRSVALRPSHAIPELKALNAAIEDAMSREDIDLRHGWRFSPHVTLAYRDAAPGIRPVHDMGWPVSEFVLVHSYVNLHRHDILGRWPLEPEPNPQLSLFAA